MKPRSILALIAVALLVFPPMTFAQSDPGVRGGSPSAGGPLASVAANNPLTILNFFNDGRTRFQQIDSVNGTVSGEPGKGLGPRYNARSCAACHAQPDVGGSSPGVNPQVAFEANADGATNTVPPFLHLSTAVQEARFVFFRDAAGNLTTTPNGGVEPLFTIAGRVDQGSCTSLAQPDFAGNIARNNIVFRIPTPVFGSGLIENIEETTLLNFAANGNPYGISGTFNRNGNDGTISRFGWKAQNKSLLLFAGEAYNVEMGVSNELFTQEHPTPEEERATGLPASCKINPTPEDHTNFNVGSNATLGDTTAFAMFMRFLAPPATQTGLTGPALISVLNGQAAFNDVGCTSCHNPTFTTSPSAFTPSLSSVQANLYSDLEVHHMGTNLADNVQQGNAGGDQFRTAPLWGLGQRIFFLHDGRTRDLLQAIYAHQSTNSEANSVILNFNALSSTSKQDVLNFLRYL